MNGKNLKAFAYGVAIAAMGAIVAEVGRDMYRKFKASKAK
jgi:hypothetical protein